jgi:hypothetical protein
LSQGIINLVAHQLQTSAQPLPQQHKERRNDTNDNNDAGQELMLNIGTIDRISKQDLLKFITVSAKLQKEDIKRFRVILKRTYISVDPDKAEDIALALQGKKFSGRPLQVQFISNTR